MSARSGPTPPDRAAFPPPFPPQFPSVSVLTGRPLAGAPPAPACPESAHVQLRSHRCPCALPVAGAARCVCSGGQTFFKWFFYTIIFLFQLQHASFRTLLKYKPPDHGVRPQALPAQASFTNHRLWKPGASGVHGYPARSGTSVAARTQASNPQPVRAAGWLRSAFPGPWRCICRALDGDAGGPARAGLADAWEGRPPGSGPRRRVRGLAQAGRAGACGSGRPAARGRAGCPASRRAGSALPLAGVAADGTRLRQPDRKCDLDRRRIRVSRRLAAQVRPRLRRGGPESRRPPGVLWLSAGSAGTAAPDSAQATAVPASARARAGCARSAVAPGRR